MILVLPLVSAFDFDNIKNVKQEKGLAGYNNIEIKNCNLWLGTCLIEGKDLWKGSLKHNTEEGCGQNCEARIDIELCEDGSLVDEIIFETILEDGSRIEQPIKEFNFYIEGKETQIEVPEYEEECEVVGFEPINQTDIIECNQVQIGTEFIDSSELINYELKEIVEGEEYLDGSCKDYTLILDGKKKLEREVDWIIKSQGAWLEEWAVWGASSLNDGLIAYYNFDESSGDLIDQTDGLYNGTNNGASYSAAGKLGTSWDFENSEQDFVVGSDNAQFRTADTSVSFWMNLEAAQNDVFYWVCIAYQTGAWTSPYASQYCINTGTDEQLKVQFNHGGSGGDIGTGFIVNAQQWYHVVLTRNSSHLKMYVDGVEKINTAISGAATYSGTPPFLIGTRHNGAPSNWADGRIDEMAVYNRSILEEEVLELFNSDNAQSYPFASSSIVLNYPTNLELFNYNEIEFSANATPSGVNLVNMSLWHNYSDGGWHRNQTEFLTGLTNTSILNSTFPDGTYLFGYEACDEDGDCSFSSTNNTFSIDTTIPFIEGFLTPSIVTRLNENVTINYTITDVNLDSCLYQYNNTNFTFVCSTGINAITNLTSVFPETEVIIYANDSLGNTNSSTLSFSYDTTFPQIEIILPTETLGFGYVGKVEELNYSITSLLGEAHLDSFWFEYNGTNTTLNGAINSTTFILDSAPHNLVLWANDTIGNTNASFLSWEYRLFRTAESFVTPTFSGIINPFTINITTNGTPITIARLHYNNTNSLATISSSGDNYSLTINQIAPGVAAAGTNISFFWNITQNGDFNFITTAQNQTVNPIVINQNCAGNDVIFNFTIVDEIARTILDATPENTSIKIDLSLYTLDGTTKLLDFSNLYSKINPAAICIDNNLSGGEQYLLDVQVEYGATDYSSEFYNVEDFILNSSTLSQNITLYDLDNDNTQKFRLMVRDTNFLPLEGALIRIERKYIENGTFFITEIPKTDEAGVTSASLELNDVIYNFNIFDSLGALVFTFTNVRAICQTPLVSECEIDFNAFQSEITIPNYEEGDDFNFTLGYNQTTRIVSSQFTIPSGEPSAVELIVIREDTLGTAVCSDTITSSAGTLTCIVPSSFGNATVMAKVFKNSIEQGKGNIKLNQDASDIFGVILITLSVLVILTLIGVAVSDNPVVTAVWLFVGLVLVFSINLVNNTGFIGATATILFFLIAVILVIIKAARRS